MEWSVRDNFVRDESWEDALERVGLQEREAVFKKEISEGVVSLVFVYGSEFELLCEECLMYVVKSSEVVLWFGKSPVLIGKSGVRQGRWRSERATVQLRHESLGLARSKSLKRFFATGLSAR